MAAEERYVEVDGQEYYIHIYEHDTDNRFQVTVTPVTGTDLFGVRSHGEKRQAGYVPGEDVADVVEGLVNDELGEGDYQTPVEQRMSEAVE